MDYVDGHELLDIEIANWAGMSAPAVSPSDHGRIYYDSILDTLRLSLNSGAYSDLLTTLSGSSLFFKLDQTTPQTVTGDKPIFSEGIAVGDGSLDIQDLFRIVEGSGVGNEPVFQWRPDYESSGFGGFSFYSPNATGNVALPCIGNKDVIVAAFTTSPDNDSTFVLYDNNTGDSADARVWAISKLGTSTDEDKNRFAITYKDSAGGFTGTNPYFSLSTFGKAIFFNALVGAYEADEIGVGMLSLINKTGVGSWTGLGLNCAILGNNPDGPNFLMNLQRNGIDQFTVGENGDVTLLGDLILGSIATSGSERLLITDEDGSNSDISIIVAGGSFGTVGFLGSNGTLALPTISANGDYLGGIVVSGYGSPSSGGGIGWILGYVDGAPVGDVVPLGLEFMTQDSAGNFYFSKMRATGGWDLGTGSTIGTATDYWEFSEVDFTGIGLGKVPLLSAVGTFALGASVGAISDYLIIYDSANAGYVNLVFALNGLAANCSFNWNGNDLALDTSLVISGESIEQNDGVVTYDIDGAVATIAVGSRTRTYTRNADGFVTSCTDGVNTWTYVRDADNKITSWSVS